MTGSSTAGGRRAGGTAARVAVVTGGSRGIGRRIAEQLAVDGMALVVGYLGNESEASAVAGGITASGGRAIAVRADVADEAAVTALFDAAPWASGSA
jgi:3-oxoacyl-[acyl-carrier protein] reductase